MISLSNAFIFEDVPLASPIALILLNSASPLPSGLLQLWKRAVYRVAADGGANLLHDAVSAADASGELLHSIIPDALVGDWDSVRPAVAAFYSGLGTTLRKDTDQNSTDLMKSLREVEEFQSSSQKGEHGGRMRVVILGGLGGRLDHEMQNLNVLYTWFGHFEHLVIVSSDSLACLLPAGTTVVEVATPFEGPTCGLIPLGGPVRSLTTEGLEWDVKEWASSFGNAISTSNEVVVGREGGGRPCVTITASDPVIWTASVHWT